MKEPLPISPSRRAFRIKGIEGAIETNARCTQLPAFRRYFHLPCGRVHIIIASGSLGCAAKAHRSCNERAVQPRVFRSGHQVRKAETRCAASCALHDSPLMHWTSLPSDEPNHSPSHTSSTHAAVSTRASMRTSGMPTGARGAGACTARRAMRMKARGGAIGGTARARCMRPTARSTPAAATRATGRRGCPMALALPPTPAGARTRVIGCAASPTARVHTFTARATCTAAS